MIGYVFIRTRYGFMLFRRSCRNMLMVSGEARGTQPVPMYWCANDR